MLNVNGPLRLEPLERLAISEGQPLRVCIFAADPDHPTLPLLAALLPEEAAVELGEQGSWVTYTHGPLPAGAAFDPQTHVLAWTPSAAQIGTYDLLLTVSDGELSARRALVPSVSYGAAPPDVLVELTPSFPVPPGQSVLVHVSAGGVAPVASLGLTIDGQPLALDQFGQARFTPQTPGHHAVVATAMDVDGNVGTATRDFKVRDPADQAAPAVSLLAPAHGAILHTPTDVLASVADANLDEYVLEIAPLGTSDFVTLARGTAPVTGAALARLDPRCWANGAYELRLTATDMAGRTGSASRRIEIATATKPGAFAIAAVDLAMVLDGVSVLMTRRYSTLDAAAQGALGSGWQLAGWELHAAANLPPTGLESSGVYPALAHGTRLYLDLPDGLRAAFTFAPVERQQGGLTYWLPAWTPGPGIAWQLETASAALQQAGDGFYQLGTGLPYHPGSGCFEGFAFTLTRSDGMRYGYDAAGQLRRIQDAGGRTLIASQSGLIAPSGTGRWRLWMTATRRSLRPRPATPVRPVSISWPTTGCSARRPPR